MGVRLTIERNDDLDMGRVRERGTAFLQTLYQQNLEPIFETWGSHSEHFRKCYRSCL
jgi:hypothetical protein